MGLRPVADPRMAPARGAKGASSDLSIQGASAGSLQDGHLNSKRRFVGLHVLPSGHYRMVQLDVT